MSIFILSWKFFTRKYESNKINISSFLPIIGLFFGVFTTILTFAVMDGLEKDIFGRINRMAILGSSDSNKEQIIHIRFTMSTFDYTVLTDFMKFLFVISFLILN